MKLQDFDFRIWNNNSKTYEAESITESLGFITSVFKQLTYKEPTIDYEIELFTGFYDKNKRKIFEGDILENKSIGELYRITRVEPYETFKIERFVRNLDGKIHKRKADFDISFLKMYNSDLNTEVISNIHEDTNPLKDM